MKRMVNIEEVKNDSEYHVLDMLRVSTHLYPVVTRICEELTKNTVGRTGQEAVAEVILHHESYEKRDDEGRYELILYEDERMMENAVGLSDGL